MEYKIETFTNYVEIKKIIQNKIKSKVCHKDSAGAFQKMAICSHANKRTVSQNIWHCSIAMAYTTLVAEWIVSLSYKRSTN